MTSPQKAITDALNWLTESEMDRSLWGEAIVGALLRKGLVVRPRTKPPATKALARRTDPDTSHEAPDELDLRELQRQVLAVFRDAGHGLTDRELIAAYTWRFSSRADSTIRTRRSELRDAGFVRDSGVRRDGQTVWVAT